jgi:hypothetical protein
MLQLPVFFKGENYLTEEGEGEGEIVMIRPHIRDI